MNLILTPVYKAWPMVVKMCKAIDDNTSGEFHHVLCLDSCLMPLDIFDQINSPHRDIILFDDGLPPANHRPCITKALQKAWDYKSKQEIEHLFVVETDVIVPLDWDKTLINLSQLIPDWITLDVMPVDEQGNNTYPTQQNIRRRHDTFGGHHFEVLQYGDWNATLFNPKVVKELGKTWRFDDVPSHHDILLSRNWREKRGYERENWEPPLFYRTDEVKAVHYANSSRKELPEGLNTPSNPA